MVCHFLRGVLAATLLAACGDVGLEGGPTEAEYRELPILQPLDPVGIDVPTDALCSIDIAGYGTKAMETDYLPNVVACEAPGNADLEMLKAQAIAARSYAYFHALTEGEICNGQSCQVFRCGRTATDQHRKAVAETSGVVLRYNRNLTIGFYVAGDDTLDTRCRGNSGGATDTEKWVTYNEGKTGSDVEQTSIGWKHDLGDGEWGQNRGALSQWGAHCLASSRGYDATKIMQYYYGDDIEFQQTSGECVGNNGFDDDSGDDGGDACGAIAVSGETIIDNGDPCLKLEGPAEFWRTESAGLGGSLNWTKSTANAEYNVAVWSLHPRADGNYRIAVHIDPAHTTGRNAQYEVVDAVAARMFDVDQTVGGWIELGEFVLRADIDGQQVRMADATGIRGEILQADALRVTPSGGKCRGGDCKNDAVDDGETLPGAEDDGGCRIGGEPGPWAPLMLLGLLGLRRRSESIAQRPR